MIKYGMEWSGNTWNGVTKPGVKNKLFLNGPHLYETDISQSFLPFSVILLSIIDRQGTLEERFFQKILQNGNIGADHDSNLRFWELKIIFT